MRSASTSVGRFLFGLGWKFLAVGGVAAVVVAGAKRHRAAKVRRFCDAALEGTTREAVARRAEEAGLLVSTGPERDTVIHNGLGFGLAWCFVRHDESRVTGTTFASE